MCFSDEICCNCDDARLFINQKGLHFLYIIQLLQGPVNVVE